MGCGASKATGEGASSGPGSAGKAPAAQTASSKLNVTSLVGIKPDTKELDVSESKELADLAGIGALVEMTKFDANSCALTALPAEIEGCAALEELLVYGNKIKDVPKELGKCAALTTINCFNNQIKKLPPDMGGLTKLDEVNFAGNKLMMLTDAHFTGWASVKILNLYDNNLVRMGSLAPLVGLEELRINGNNLEEMPGLSMHEKLTVIEMHKNRFAAAPDDYFKATPALERLRIDGNMLTALPPSLLALDTLVGVQAQENKLESLPAAAWPSKLETLFLQGNEALKTLPEELKALKALKRVNLTGLTALDEPSEAVAKDVRMIVLTNDDGIFWGVSGKKELS